MKELHTFPLLAVLQEEDLNRLAKRGRMINLTAGTVLHSPHDACRRVSFVLDGRLVISRILPSGSEYVIRTLQAGETFGEMVAFSPSATYPGWVVAVEDAVVFELENTLLLNCMERREFLTTFLAELSQHSLFLLQRLEFLNLKTIRQKIAGYLLGQIEKQYSSYGESFPQGGRGLHDEKPLQVPGPGAFQSEVVLQVPRNELAKLLGNSREAVSRELAVLEAVDAITRRGRGVIIRDALALENILLGEDVS